MTNKFQIVDQLTNKTNQFKRRQMMCNYQRLKSWHKDEEMTSLVLLEVSRCRTKAEGEQAAAEEEVEVRVGGQCRRLH